MLADGGEMTDDSSSPLLGEEATALVSQGMSVSGRMS